MSSIFFKPDYDYYANFVHDWEEVGNFINTCLTAGRKLINDYKENEVNTNLVNLDTTLGAFASAIYFRLTIYGFRWNECLQFHLDLNSDNKNNWFYFVAEINNFEKHLDREIRHFFHGFCTPRKYFDKKSQNKLLKLYQSGQSNVYQLQKFVEEAIYRRRKIMYQINRDHELDAFKEFLKIDDFDEYYVLSTKYLPIYQNTLTTLCNIFRKRSFKSGAKTAIKLINNTKVSKKIKKVWIVKNWEKYIKNMQEVCYFNAFIIAKFKTSNFSDLEKFKKSEIAQHINDLWTWYEENKEEFLRLYNLKFPVKF